MPSHGLSESEQVVVDVLVVEDDEEMRTGMVELLDSEQLAVGWATNGREALKLVEAGVRPRLLVLDMQMPVMDGWKFLEERRTHEVLREVPVLLTTGLDRVQILPSDVVACLHKPVEPDVLLDVVRQYAHSEPVFRRAAGALEPYLPVLSGVH
jgi:CheY-like chemotaxis protein